jgi:hypothetical protein
VAFDAGAAVGWPRVEAAIRRYKIMPGAFFDDPAAYFDAIRTSLQLPLSPTLAAA